MLTLSAVLDIHLLTWNITDPRLNMGDHLYKYGNNLTWEVSSAKKQKHTN